MAMKITDLAAAVALLITGQAYANGGAVGANGTSSLSGLIGNQSEGNPGTTGAAADGQDGQSFNGTASIVITDELITGTKGENGKTSPTNSKGGGGAGGHGGASVIGAVSTGGAGGNSSSSLANGGKGGDVLNNQIMLNNVQLDGSDASGGNGGSYSSSDSDSGGPGSGGHGGGSVFGGISTGGAAGAFPATLSTSDSANGGDGGEVSGNYIEITNSKLIGGAGGQGGSTYALGGSGGHGGGSVFGGISTGGAAGYLLDLSSNYFGHGSDGGLVIGNTIKITGSALTGAEGGQGGNNFSGLGGGRGSAGHGGGSVVGGISSGAAGRSTALAIMNAYTVSSNGGDGGGVSDNTIEITGSSLTGAAGGRGIMNDSGDYTSGGTGGHGGGSVFGGISTGGAAGASVILYPFAIASVNGGDGGEVSGNTIKITGSALTGAEGGQGGNAFSEVVDEGTGGSTGGGYGGGTGGGGAGGHGGGSVFGGISTGAAAGGTLFGRQASANGGKGGDVLNNQITLHNVQLDGSNAVGGQGGSSSLRAVGAGGHGGGSVFGGISTGGAAGGIAYGEKGSANGGKGGDVLNNQITLHNVQIDGSNAAGGQSGSSTAYGRVGPAGYSGGSVFGGISTGGSGGYFGIRNFTPDTSAISAAGGDGGNTSNNVINILGDSTISGDVYGGYSQGGVAGIISIDQQPLLDGEVGKGGFAQNNTITLYGQGVQIAGRIYGGYSANGDGSLNPDKAFSGNTLNLEAFRGSVQGIHNVEHYNWNLPEDVVNNDTIIHITGDEPVDLDNTKHTVTISSEGKHLKKGEQITLIDKVVGEPYYVNDEILRDQQGQPIQVGVGHLLLQNARLDVVEDSAMLTMLDDAIINPKAKVFLERRVGIIALVNQGSDMMANYSMDPSACKNTLFTVAEGGSNRYKIQSRVELRDFKFALGASHCFELPSQNKVMLGGFFEYGHANFDSYSKFDGEPDVHGWGDAHYSGLGLIFHMNVAGTSRSQASKPLIEGKDGLYINAVLRGGRGKSYFETDDLRNEANMPASFDAKSPYYSAMAGIGYAINFSDKHALDVYGRYTWSKVKSNSVWIGNEKLDMDSSDSSRLRLGARYRFAATDKVVPYVGVAYEREFGAKVTGSTDYQGQTFEVPPIHLKGNTGMVELGMTVTPVASNDALTLNAGVQGYFGHRRGASAEVSLRYAF